MNHEQIGCIENWRLSERILSLYDFRLRVSYAFFEFLLGINEVGSEDSGDDDDDGDMAHPQMRHLSKGREKTEILGWWAEKGPPTLALSSLMMILEGKRLYFQMELFVLVPEVSG